MEMDNSSRKPGAITQGGEMVRDEEARSAFLAGETYYNYNFCLQVAQTFETFIIDNETRGALRGINPYANI